MAHLWNPLATAEQLEESNSSNALPSELQDSIRYSTVKLTQAAGILLRLPQAIAAQALIVLLRFYVVEDLMKYEFGDVSAASIYLTAKISASPRSLRSITNVYAYLLSSHSPLNTAASPSSTPKNDPESYYLSESAYIIFRNRILHIEGQVLHATGFNMHVALPHPLAITYLQALDVFGSSQPHGTGARVAKRAMAYLNTALLSPQMLYLTHQPTALATAAIYLAARDEGAKLPGVEWWEVFDTDREDLGFLALGMQSLEGWARSETERWRGKAVLARRDVRDEMARMGMAGGGDEPEDEEARLMRMMDERTS